MAVGVHPQRGWWRCGGVGDAMQAVGVHPQVVVVVLYSAERGCTPKGSGDAVQWLWVYTHGLSMLETLRWFADAFAFWYSFNSRSQSGLTQPSSALFASLIGHKHSIGSPLKSVEMSNSISFAKTNGCVWVHDMDVFVILIEGAAWKVRFRVFAAFDKYFDCNAETE